MFPSERRDIEEKATIHQIRSRFIHAAMIVLLTTLAYAQHPRVGLTWTGSSGASTYNVYRSLGTCASPTFSQLATGIVPTSYTDTYVVGSTDYCYGVTAVNANGESAMSGTALAPVPPPPGPPNLGQNCTNGCGIGTHILPSTLTVTLCDTANAGCASGIPAESNVSSYPTLPLTIDARSINFDWQTDVPANGFVVCGSLQQNSDRIQFDTSAPGVYVIGTTHHVTVRNLVPASHSGGGGGAGVSCYVGDNTNATTSDPKQRYDPGTNTWPGPLCYAGGPACSLYITPPNPTAATLQWSATPAGVINAQRGFPAQIPLYILWNGGNATTVGGFPTCNSGTLNQLYHQYQAGQWAAPNSGTWFQCKGSGPTWTSLGSQLPVFFVSSSTITDPSANVYTCPGSANGGESPSGIPRVPADTCTGGAGDSHISVTPFYTGIYVGNSPQTDYRPIHYSTSPAGYYFDMNGTAVPVNAVPTSTVQFFPAATATTGTWTGTVTLTMYTDQTLTTPAAGTAPFTFSYSIAVGDDTPITQVDPGSYPADPNLPAWTAYTSQQSVGMCSDSTGGTGDAMDYFNLNLHYWMWLTFGAGDWGPYNTGNYDNSRWFSAAGDYFLKKMDGTAWPDLGRDDSLRFSLPKHRSDSFDRPQR